MRTFLAYVCVLMMLPVPGRGFDLFFVVGAVGLGLIVLTSD
jgi:hypothetical protein